MASSCSVIICAYTLDRWGDLRQAVDSIRRQTAVPGEIVVVCDHNPELLDRARAELPGCLVVPNSEERGLSGARNSGIAAASRDIVAFLDDDAVAEGTWLEALLRCYADDQVLGVGGAIVPIWINGRPAWFPGEFLWVVGCTYRGMPTYTASIRNLIGANMSFRRTVFSHVGGFRTGIGRVGKRPLGCEETELCIRVLQHYPDSVLLYEPTASVGHRVPASRSRVSYFWSRCYAEGLSKALVSRLVGADAGLSSERVYTFRTLPRGMLHGVFDALGGDLSGLSRSITIGAGLGATTAGYVVGIRAAKSMPAVPPPSVGLAAGGMPVLRLVAAGNREEPIRS